MQVPTLPAEKVSRQEAGNPIKIPQFRSGMTIAEGLELIARVERQMAKNKK
jgi:hypothetical protein